MAALTGTLHLKIGVLFGFGRVRNVFVGEAEVGQPPRMRRIAEAQRNVDPLQRFVVRLAADASDVRALFQPLAIYDRHRRVGTTRNDVRAFIRIARMIHGRDFKPVFLADLFDVGIAILFCRTVDLNLFDLAR